MRWILPVEVAAASNEGEENLRGSKVAGGGAWKEGYGERRGAQMLPARLQNAQ